jgi:hypothetical protein
MLLPLPSARRHCGVMLDPRARPAWCWIGQNQVERDLSWGGLLV